MTEIFRLEGGIGAIAGGLFLLGGHLFNYAGGQAAAGTPVGKGLVLIGHVTLVFAFVGLYSHQHEQGASRIGRAGTILSVVGTVLVGAIVFVELAGTAGVDTTPVFRAAGTTILYTVGPLVFVLGMVLVGGSILRRDDLPRGGGGLLILGTAVFAAASGLTRLAGLLTVLGAALTAAGFGWLGIGLLTADTRRMDTGVL